MRSADPTMCRAQQSASVAQAGALCVRLTALSLHCAECEIDRVQGKHLGKQLAEAMAPGGSWTAMWGRLVLVLLAMCRALLFGLESDCAVGEQWDLMGQKRSHPPA